MTWIGAAVALAAWLAGLLLGLGATANLLLVAAAVLLVAQAVTRRGRRAS